MVRKFLLRLGIKRGTAQQKACNAPRDMGKGGRHCVLWKRVRGESVDRDGKGSLP